MVPKKVYLDTTYLRHAKDLRGIPQVILQLTRLFAADVRFSQILFITTEQIYGLHLAGLGIGRDRIRIVGMVPILGRAERFHGLFSTYRYRKLMPDAAMFIHPELRTVLRTSVPQVVMYHDLIIFEKAPIRGKRSLSRFLLFYYKNWRASRVSYKISNSEFTKQRMLALFPSMTGDIRVLHLGARGSLGGASPTRYFPADRIQYFYVGSFDGRKNISALLEHLQEVTGGAPFDFHLAGWLDYGRKTELEKKILEFGLIGSVHVHGLVSDSDLKYLFERSHFLLFPSLFEGFGLPIVEAMSVGIVVCAFENSCIPEIGGDAIVLCRNGDFQGWGKRIREMVNTPTLYREMGLKALHRAEYFSEAKMLERYAAYFLEIIPSACL